MHISKLHNLDSHVSYVGHRLGNNNVFLVGGCVRDILLGITQSPHDLDVTLAGQPKSIANAIDKSDISFFMTEKYGTMTIIPKGNLSDTNEPSEKLQYEITPFRTESGYSDDRHPDQVNWTDNIVLDAQRRDFSINALYYTAFGNQTRSYEAISYDESVVHKHLIKEGVFLAEKAHIMIVANHELISLFFPSGKFDEHAFQSYFEKNYPDFDYAEYCSGSFGFIIDPYNGLVDLLERKIKAVGKPEDRISEDALRILRALRFVNVLNAKLALLPSDHNKTQRFFDVEKLTWKALRLNYYRLQNVSKERLKIELDKSFKAKNPFGLVGLLEETNLLKYLFPSVYATQGVKQPVRYHPFDVYVHSLLALHAVQQINDNYLVKYATLYHDVGKTEQYYTYTMGLDQDEARGIFGTWLNHVTCGADMAKKDFDALGFSRKEVDEICWYVANHMKPGEILMASKDNWAKKLRKLLSDGGEERVNNLLDITIADRLGQYNPVQPTAIDDVYELKQILQKLVSEEGQFTMKSLAINGTELMEAMNIEAGPQLGELLNKAFNWVMDDIENRNNKESILNFLKT